LRFARDCLTPTILTLLIFAYCSRSGRLSPRNTFVARKLEADFIFDMLTKEGVWDKRNVFMCPFPASGTLQVVACEVLPLESRRRTESLSGPSDTRVERLAH
jgi:hypothetical protein